MRFDELGLSELIILVAVATVYFMPWFIAILRRHHRRFMIGLLNLLLGWTLIGWLITFFWAAGKTRAGHEQKEAESVHPREEQISIQPRSGNTRQRRKVPADSPPAKINIADMS